MAGIGFELKKIFKEESLSRTFMGIGYSSIITLGPTFSIMATVIALYILLGYSNIAYADRNLLSSTILYLFIFSTILSAPFNSVFSRYISDKIFEEKFEDILPSFYTGIAVTGALATILVIPFAWRLYVVGGVPLFFVVMTVLTFYTLNIVFFSMIFLHATKDYKVISFSFLISMLIGVLAGFFLNAYGVLNNIEAILCGLEIGLFLVAFLEFAYIRKYFQSDSENYYECLGYIWNYKALFLCNLFYTGGLYVHNFVFWTTPMRVVVADSYFSLQAYDMASCLAVFTSISAMILFTVMSETKFHDKYQVYNSAVITSTLEQINKSKKSMFRMLNQEMNALMGVQAIISILLFLLVIIFLPDYGFGGMVMAIYPALAAAFYVIFILYCNIIFLYYFNDYKGALFTSASFFATTFLASIVTSTLAPEFYGLGVFVGALVGWAVSFLRIQYLEKHFERHIFCTTEIINRNKGKEPDSVIYRRSHNGQKNISV